MRCKFLPSLQGTCRCRQCKKMSYCSIACQSEDWAAHRHVCKPVDPQPGRDAPKETTAQPIKGDGTSLSVLNHNDASSPQRVYFKDLNMTKIIKGTEIKATVIEFYSPSRFFLLPQSPELLKVLKTISTELQKTYSSSSLMTYVPVVGEVCAVQFSFDMKWYRGLVQTLTADQKMADILYIDFGNEENVPVERIRPLAVTIQPFCPCVLECHVAGAKPASADWSEECCSAVGRLLVAKMMTVKLLNTDESGRIHSVDIMLFMGKQLSTFLVDNGYAAGEPVKVPPTKQEMNDMVSTSLENFKCRSDGDNNTWAQPPELLTQAKGDKLVVVVTHFQSPIELVVQKVDNAGVIQDLQLKLREHCSQVPAQQNFRPAPGTVCCAQFSEDKQWYRAKVLAYSSEERICVGYLDFGNSEEVDLGHLRPISASLLALPNQAIRCGLAGVQPVEKNWSEDCLFVLQQRVSNRILCIEIHGADNGKALVTMIDEASDPQANIAELLISAGYAAPAPVISSVQQASETTIAAESHACEPLVWSTTELPCDSQTVVLLASHVENPGAFYCRIDNPTDNQHLMELQAQLKQHCEIDFSPFEPKVGEPCCALFPGDGWCRVMVNGVSGDKVSVNSVDYGYSIEIEKSHLRSITPQLLILPFQAFCCWLTGVEPLASEWSSEALLWFQNLVNGAQLSARVLSVTKQGYGVELEKRGLNVAAALISEHLAKIPEGLAKDSAMKHYEGVKENIPSQLKTQVSHQAEANPKKMPAEGQTASSTEGPSFPVDWKTVELPLNETFQPCFVALISPSHFYLLSSTQVDQRKLQEVMMEIAVYCSKNQNTVSAATESKPAPGAACCAQFSADNNWYRAVVLDVGENEVGVIYADYGNREMVPFSRILPISVHLLQLPFMIARCTLIGKEHCPSEWSEDVQQMFETALLNGVLATVESYNGSNVVTLTLSAESGGGTLNDMILKAVSAQMKRGLCPTTIQMTEKSRGSDPQTSTCCCLSLKAKIDELEELMKMQLALLKQIIQQTK
ncbi:tudor domain-containing protein 1 [Pholidichthys leucotaenia]